MGLHHRGCTVHPLWGFAAAAAVGSWTGEGLLETFFFFLWMTSKSGRACLSCLVFLWDSFLLGLSSLDGHR